MIQLMVKLDVMVIVMERIIYKLDLHFVKQVIAKKAFLILMEFVLIVVLTLQAVPIALI